MSSKSLSLQIQSISNKLTKNILSSSSSSDHQNIDSSDCIELLKSLEDITTFTSTTSQIKDNNESSSSSSSSSYHKIKNHNESKITIDILNETKIGICLNKLMKSFRRFNRTSSKDNSSTSIASKNNNNTEWGECMIICERLLSTWKETVKQERENGTTTASSLQPVDNQTNDGSINNKNNNNKSCDGLPTSVGMYRSRLLLHKKEIYKDPPTLPPQSITIEENYCPFPKRNKSNGELSFVLSSQQMSLSSQSKLNEYIKDFKPNRTPEEVMRAGSFGGTYFRPITSSVTNVRYNPTNVLKDTVKPEWIVNLDKKTMLTSSTYNASVNKYKVKCGGSLGMWESSGWISDSDPYGWFQWYCNFYRGRRCSDDERQISRWLKSAGPTGRFRSQLCNKIFAQGGFPKINDVKISPVIRQTLLHWGLEITEDVLRKHGKRVGKL